MIDCLGDGLMRRVSRSFDRCVWPPPPSVESRAQIQFLVERRVAEKKFLVATKIKVGWV